MYCPIMSYQKDHTCKVDCSTDCAWNQNGCLVAKALIAVAGSEIPSPVQIIEPKFHPETPVPVQVVEPKFRPPVNVFPWGDQ